MKTSQLSENLKGSEIIKIAGEVKALQAKGEKIYNLTIGDFDSKIFPIPSTLKNLILQNYQEDLTNYPAGNGEAKLRQNVSGFLKDNLGLDYSENEILIAGGARPLIYAVYQTILDLEDTVLYPVPSWNNDAYTYLARNKEVAIQVSPENKFMPTADDMAAHIETVNLIAVCSPLNPTGTTFEKAELEKICDLIIAENKRRKELELKPLYLLYDQIYWQLTYGEIQHYNPVSLRCEMRDYTIFIDGISKAFAATGVRVGWAFGPQDIINKMKDILSHVGAWAPKPEQMATAHYLEKRDDISTYLTHFKKELEDRLNELYKGFNALKELGFPVEAIRPEAAMYLTVKFDLIGKQTADGKTLNTVQEITQYLLEEGKVAIVPFYAFGAPDTNNWFRISVGTTSREDIPLIIDNIVSCLQKLN